MLDYPGIDSSRFLNDSFLPFEVDIELEDNSVMDLGNGTTVEILAPRSTRDHHSYYLPKEKILIAGEAAGLPSTRVMSLPNFCPVMMPMYHL